MCRPTWRPSCTATSRRSRLGVSRRGRAAHRLAHPAGAGRRLGAGASLGSAPVAYEFKLPDLGEGLTEGEIARWLVEEGQDVAEDAPLVEIADGQDDGRDPVPRERNCLEDPRRRRRGRPGRNGSGRDRRGRFCRPVPGTETGPETTPPPAPSRRRGQEVRATPLVRKVAQELGVELSGVTGTGPQGRITEEDVRAACLPVPGTGTVRKGRMSRYAGIRRQMFEHLTRAHREIPAGDLGRGVRVHTRRVAPARSARPRVGRGGAAASIRS